MTAHQLVTDRLITWPYPNQLLGTRSLAELAGYTQGYIAQIEAGTTALDKRSAQLALAAALQVSVADLTGQPYDPQTIEHTAARTATHRLRAAVPEASLAWGGRWPGADPEVLAQQADPGSAGREQGPGRTGHARPTAGVSAHP
jgi:transcriptional regulator with XRE-family HTH domain